MCPENTGLSNLEVSAGDSDFINVIAPAAVSAISLSEAQSPVPNCKFVSLLFLPLLALRGACLPQVYTRVCV